MALYAGKRFGFLLCILPVLLLWGCGASSGEGGGAAGNGAPPTFTAGINAVKVTRLDNDESVPVEGASERGAVITVE